MTEPSQYPALGGGGTALTSPDGGANLCLRWDDLGSTPTSHGESGGGGMSAAPQTGSVTPTTGLVLVDPHEAQGWRVRQDERLDRLFEQKCDWISQYGRADQLAVDARDDTGDLRLTYDELDRRANQLARYLRLRGCAGGDRIGLLYDRPAHSYIAMLAVLKIGATYVPLDVRYPTGRLAYIVEDARVRTVLSMSHVAEQVEQIELLTGGGAELVYVDRAAPLIAEMDSRRLLDAERGRRLDSLAYISYGSVSGRPEGVAIDHPSICNFVKVAAEIYGIRPRDRVYQGLPIALDFSVEEIWVPWLCGATLVPKPAGPSLLGPDLHRFLSEARVTALCCVPPVLATLEDDLPDLRFLLICGKDTPRELIDRWLRPGRRFLSVYGPTEATVTATWTELRPGKPVTIGVPLPTYCTVILDPRDPSRALPHGEVGEIGIAGIGLACGYLNHDDLTDESFIPDFLDIPANPSGRIYRTGDLGRVNADLELEYHGRVDGTADSAGYRLELADVESLLRIQASPGAAAAPGAAAVPYAPPGAVAPPYAPPGAAAPPYAPPAGAGWAAAAPPDARAAAPGPGNPVQAAFAEMLAAVTGVDRVSPDSHFFDDLGADSLVMAQFCARVRRRPELPSVSMKDIYRFPTVARLAGALADDESTPMERSLLEVLAALVGSPVAHISPDSHFFDDLGADSLVMAQFCARVRKRVDLPSISMRDIYAYSTIRALSTALAEAEAGAATAAGPPGHPERGAPAAGSAPAPAGGGAPYPPGMPAGPYQPAPDAPLKPVGPLGHALCGVAQLLIVVGFAYLGALVLVSGLEWIVAGIPGGTREVLTRSVVFGAGSFVAASLAPILVKWLLVGEWTPRRIRVWSLGYLRFWLVKIMIRSNPLARFVGSPIYVSYLRALGARIGPGVAIFAPTVPVCTDLITVGAGTVISKSCTFTGYRAQDGEIQTGPVTLGREVFVGDATVLDVDTAIGDGGQVGHTSALHTGQRVPAGERWHGSPAQRTHVDYARVAPARCGWLRRLAYPGAQLLTAALVPGLTLGALVLLVPRTPKVAALLGPGPQHFTTWVFYRDVAAVSYLLFVGGLVVSVLFVMTVPRLLRPLVRPDRVYPLYGLGYWAQRTITGTTNSKFLAFFFGDSSYIVGYLRGIGYRLTPVEQTGSNFGQRVQHDSPYLCSVGTGTVIADGLTFLNAEYSATSFTVSGVSIGARSFLGNNIAYPAGAKVGGNCLLGTKVMVPIDGPVRENVGLLGSPCFEIPRSVERDTRFDHLATGDEFHRRLAAKNRHNIVTMVLYLMVRWFPFFVGALLTVAAEDLYHVIGAAALAAAGLVALLFSTCWFVLVERAVRGLQTRAPGGCSIYDRGFWRHERFWKVPAQAYQQVFNGTPLKPVIWRLLGVRIGRRVFDDGCGIVEKTFVTIGDGCTLNAGSIIQCHSQEDGAFKSDHTSIGAGCTLGVGAFVHYGVTMGDRVVLEADSFLMKGEDVPSDTRWGGNPASELRQHRSPALAA
ncbi:MAG: Pls/PosA family non-ribosomal peptide synthetase [Pseudonocardia sp.]